jgi:hypothetical protein
MMSQTHIGYTYWQQPEQNLMPEVREIELPSGALMGVAVEGTGRSWPGSTEKAELPVTDAVNRQVRYLEIFRRGTLPFRCTVEPSENWITPSRDTAWITMQKRIYLEINWKIVPEGMHEVPVLIKGPEGESLTVIARIDNRSLPDTKIPEGTFMPEDGVISMEAASYHRAVTRKPLRWAEVPNLGRTRSAMITLPVTAPGNDPGGKAPRLEYRFLVTEAGSFEVISCLSPTLDFQGKGGMEFAVSIDDGAPVRVNMHPPGRAYLWNRWVSDNIIEASTELVIPQPGVHTLHWWRIDAAPVLQKIVIAPAGWNADSYLGPPESIRYRP